MQRPTGVAIAVLIGLTAVIVPIWFSIHLAWKQSLADETARVRYNAGDVLRRGEETRNQVVAGTRMLTKANLPPCSPAEIDLMRRIDLDSSYIQAVARIQGDSLICTSLGTRSPIPVGSATVISKDGAAQRLNVKIPVAGSQPLDIFSSSNGFAFLIHPGLPLDTASEGPDISLALYLSSSPDPLPLAATGSHLRPEWFRSIAKGSEATFVDRGYVVCIAHSAASDLAVVAAAPVSYVARRIARIAALFVPLGLLCGIALAWAVIHVTRQRFSLPSVLRVAALHREFYVEYQPVVEMSSRRWIGAEALVRWRRPGGRIVRPDEFIPTAEESGVITLITQCVASIVAADLPRFLSIDPEFRVAMNLSAADLRSKATLPLLEEITQADGAHSANLEVEATERGFLQGPEVRGLIAKIRSQGITVSIDDFGTGYSSLSCLQSLGLDTLKIDKAFVNTIGTDGATSRVVFHIIEMAHSLNLEIVAEGVETEEQASFLLQRGVRHAQGWLFGKPMPVATFCESLLQAKSAREQETHV
jgi:sensor c-di-GMP phosphodiesterase-like protein